MNVEFKYSLGDEVQTRRGDGGTIVAMSVTEGRDHGPLFRSYRLRKADGQHEWCPEYRIESVVGW